MKILYAIQGTGNGHIARALALGPALEDHADVDYLLSGYQSDIDLGRPIRFRKHGASFIFGSKGGIDVWKTLRQAAPLQLIRDIKSIPLSDYDLVVNDFEPITAWALRSSPHKIIGVSHQAAFQSEACPRPARKRALPEAVLQYFAPTKHKIGLHFQAYDDTIMTPIVRRKIRQLATSKAGHVTVYLAAYDTTYLVSLFQEISDVTWHIFSKQHKGEVVVRNNCMIYPAGHEHWYRSLAESEAVVLGAGFEGPSEALFLGKKLLAIPMRNQYEQQCNAVALEGLGVTVLQHLGRPSKAIIRDWLINGKAVHIKYPDHTDELVEKVLTQATAATPRFSLG